MAGESSRKRNGGRKRRRRRKRPNPMDQLTDDLLVEILSRVPYKSLRRFTCVSRRWRDLIAHPDHRRKLPQTLAGFFYYEGPIICFGDAPTHSFVNASGTGPPLVDTSLAFLPDRERESRLTLLDGCKGFLLFRCYRFADPMEFDYLVINPATEEWVAVPVTRRWSVKVETVRLGFDPAVSSHFHVFEFQLDDDGDEESEDSGGDGHVLRVKIYSSESGLWSYKQSGWEFDIRLDPDFRSAFVDGKLYVVALQCVVSTVDVEGRTWSEIEFPRSEKSPLLGRDVGFIDLSQGRLHFATCDDIDGKLAIWVLEDWDSEQWSLKHTVNFNYLVGRPNVGFGFHQFIIVAVHPQRNMVFFVFGRNRTLMSYDMDSREVRTICDLGYNCMEHFIPYVPLFSASLANGQQ